MSFLQRLFGKKPAAPAVASPPNYRGSIPHDLPLALRIGAMVTFDRTRYLVAPDAVVEQLPDGFQEVQCYGYADLGDGHLLQRFYLADDAYLQVMTVGGEVDAVQAFVYCEQVNPANQAAFREFVASHDHLWAPEIHYAGHLWRRHNQGETGLERMPPMALEEILFRGQTPRQSDDLTNYATLYTRQVAELGMEELLLVTAEDSGANEFLVSYAVGMNMNSSDFEIT
ncbi:MULTISPECIES: DUF2491 family protein [Stenotrophomonas]|uniref:DUF2491 family protein n=1 Tax=Stenotrophomonas TaxID=40323 RepID=UPI002DBDA94C|nr:MULTISPECIES: DUF2491 family protein [Stenotrophomonas]MEC4339816.1 DUF2491 family protein [Stenotrophomonas pavanii]